VNKRKSTTARLFSFSGFGRLVGLMMIATPLIVGVIAALQVSAVGAKGTETAQNETLVRCNPTTAVGIMGQPLAVELYIENIVDLWVADVRLSFDTSMAQIVDADPITNGVQIELLDDFLSPDFVLNKSGDNVAGMIKYMATQVNPSEPVSGSGPLARVTFQPQQTGTFIMPITYHLLGTIDGFEIEATPIDCRITFIEGGDPDLTTYLPAAFAQ